MIANCSSLLRPPTLRRRSIREHQCTPSRRDGYGPSCALARGLLGFVVGFLSLFVIEAFMIVTAEFQFNMQPRPVKPGWIIPSLIGGCVGWRLAYKKVAQPLNRSGLLIRNPTGGANLILWNRQGFSARGRIDPQ